LKHERIELNYNRADETRGYAERVSIRLVTWFVCPLVMFLHRQV
jgi:hypothetical protein